MKARYQALMKPEEWGTRKYAKCTSNENMQISLYAHKDVFILDVIIISVYFAKCISNENMQISLHTHKDVFLLDFIIIPHHYTLSKIHSLIWPILYSTFSIV